MLIYVISLTILSLIWLVFEISLVIRDRIRGRGKTARDRGTRNFNFIAITIGLTAGGFANGYSLFFFPGGRTIPVFWAGFAVMSLGLALRIYAIAILGKSFRTTVEIHENQKVVKKGPYRFIRHPSYTGLILMCCGYGVALQNWLSLILAVSFPLAAILYRIHVEEAVLAESIGEEYKEYRRHTKKLIPWVW